MAASFLTRRLNSVLSVVPSRNHFGYLPFEGRVPNDRTEAYQQRAQIKAINLKPVKRMQFQVDPLHRRSSSIRQLMTIISDEKITRTGPKTAINYKFVSDRSEPKVTLTFHDDAELKAVINMAYLTEHEAIYHMNKLVLPLVKDETANVEQSKGAKKAAGSKKGKK